MEFDDEEIVTNISAKDRTFTQQISEATGNEGATMERWYRQAAVVIWPRERFVRILAGEGPEHAIPALEELVAASAEPTNDAACRKFATEIVGHWEQPKHSYSATKQQSLPSRMLTLLDRLGAADLAARSASRCPTNAARSASRWPTNWKGTSNAGTMTKMKIGLRRMIARGSWNPCSARSKH